VTQPTPDAQAAGTGAVPDAATAGETPVAPPETPAQAASSHAARLAAMRSNSRLLWTLVIIIGLYTCYFASSLILPLVMAAFFAMLLSPLINRAPLRWLPRGLAALMLVSALVGSLGAVAVFVSGPASEWARNVPFLLREATPKIKSMIEPIMEARRASESFDEFTAGDVDIGERVVVRPPSTDLLSATPRVLGSVLAVLLLTFAFLVYGDDVLNKLMRLRRTRAQKRLTADIVQHIQSDLSRYVLTISATSAVLGGVTAVYLWYLGVEDPLLWGVLAAALNLTPFVGPLIMAMLLSLVGLSQFDTIGAALLPAAGFLVLHAVESNVLTPMVLGRTMRINPLAIILWLLLWGWLWGVVGLLVAVPMLVCLKIVASRVEAWQHWSKLLE
jgi:predicted PurR-regulated permease PerM